MNVQHFHFISEVGHSNRVENVNIVIRYLWNKSKLKSLFEIYWTFKYNVSIVELT